jgi:hypothetical protein
VGAWNRIHSTNLVSIPHWEIWKKCYGDWAKFPVPRKVFPNFKTAILRGKLEKVKFFTVWCCFLISPAISKKFNIFENLLESSTFIVKFSWMTGKFF